MIVVFDMDDTLYEEVTYVHSGYQAVSQYLDETYAIPASESLALMLYNLKEGRGVVFDKTLQHFGYYTPTRIKQCISVYRTHLPKIQLLPDAEACLTRLRKLPLYIVTDGNKTVQGNKLKALRLARRVRFCFATYRYGLKYAKPSPYCFLKICQREKVSPEQVVYIADNPHKDFVGIKPLGFKTVRIRRGPHQDAVVAPEFDADYKIQSLEELELPFLQDVFNSSNLIHKAAKLP